MPNSTNNKRREPVEKILADFDKKHHCLEELCTQTKDLIECCLEEAGLRCHSIQYRVKKKDKLREKYLDPTKAYKKLDDITDQAALRVITYYEDEIDKVANIIQTEFKLIPDHCKDRRVTEPDRFGYRAFNFVCLHSDQRVSDVLFRKFAGIRFEIQVTSILSHAWSEIEHEWYDVEHGSYPEDIKRRFSRQAALIEIAESEFLNLRNLKKKFDQSMAIRIQAKVLDSLVNPVSLKTFILEEPIVEQMDNTIIQSILGVQSAGIPSKTNLNVWSSAAQEAGLNNLKSIRDTLSRYESEVFRYVQGCREHWHTRPAAQLERGVCVYHLAMMLIAREGHEKLAKAIKKLKIQHLSAAAIRGQYEVAQIVLSHEEKDKTAATSSSH